MTQDGDRVSTYCAREKSLNGAFSFLDSNMFRYFIDIDKAKGVVRDGLKLREGMEVAPNARQWRWR